MTTNLIDRLIKDVENQIDSANMTPERSNS